jgi:ribosomal protein S12 methylthiotransferase accessory factor
MSLPSDCSPIRADHTPSTLVAPEPKVVQAGTHRMRTAEETLARLAPLLYGLGISRVADVTWLDDIGMPVFQAVRPKSRCLAVSQGKGITAPLAKVSAIMECLEVRAAESPTVALKRTLARDLELPYDVGALARDHFEALARTAALSWCAAVDLQSGAQTFVPLGGVTMDWTVLDRWSPSIFESNSNGLASGNSFSEAAVHGLCEVLERWGLATPDPVRIDPATVTEGSAAHLIERFSDAGLVPEIVFFPNTGGIPVFTAVLPSDDFPVAFRGHGCHLDADVALCRALTEAAQSRATHIAGSRDDMWESTYEWRATRWRPAEYPSLAYPDAVAGLTALPSGDVAEDLRILLASIRDAHPVVLAVDLSVVVGVHVVKVIIPTLPRYLG